MTLSIGLLSALIGERYIHPGRNIFPPKNRTLLKQICVVGTSFGIIFFTSPNILLLSIPIVLILSIIVFTDFARMHVHPAIYLLIPYGIAFRYALLRSFSDVLLTSGFGILIAAVLFIGIYIVFRGKFGFGDVGVGIAAGACLGVEHFSLVILLSSIVGIACALVRSKRAKIKNPRIPFAAIMSLIWLLLLGFHGLSLQ